MNEEYFDITGNERISILTGPKGNTKIKQLENQSDAKIHITEWQSKTMIRVFGNSSQRGEAKVLIRDVLEKTSFIPTISYFILSKSNKNRLRFVKFNKSDYYNNDYSFNEERTHYVVEFVQQNDRDNVTDEIIDIFQDFLFITPLQFNTFDKMDDCLERLSLKLKTSFKKNSQNRTDSLFSEQMMLKPRIFFGKVLFSEINNPDDSFTLRDWRKFNVLSGRGRRESLIGQNESCFSDGKTVNVEFRQDSPQIYEDFKIIQQKFGFKLDFKQVVQGKDKGSITIYYSPSTNKKRKLKLRWDKEKCKWKIINDSYGLNRLANIDVISGSKAPDFRLSIKTHYNLSSEGSKAEDVINNIQYDSTFAERDDMWFKSSDFRNTIINKAVVRQVIEKKRFRNEDFHITFSTVKHCDVNDTITIQKLITLKHKTWSQKFSSNNVEGFMSDVADIFDYAQRMISSLVA